MKLVEKTNKNFYNHRCIFSLAMVTSSLLPTEFRPNIIPTIFEYLNPFITLKLSTRILDLVSYTSNINHYIFYMKTNMIFKGKI